MTDMTTQELMDTVCPPIRDLAWAYYFVEETTVVGAELGLDVLSFYFVGRGGLLGDVEPSVARAAFGYFEPNMFAAMWNAGREVADVREAGRRHFLCAAEHGRRSIAELDGLEALCAAAEAVVDASDETSLPLYAAFKAAQVVDDLPGRTMQRLAQLREFRGSAHLLALRAVGLDQLAAHALNRPNDLAMFGWSDDAVPELTDEHRAQRDEAEAITDRIVGAAYEVLDQPARVAFVEGIAKVHEALTGRTLS